MARALLPLAATAWTVLASPHGSAFVATEFDPRFRTRSAVRAPSPRTLERGRGRGRVAMGNGRAYSAQWMPMQELTEDRAMLVLVRHGQSEWNFANRFIGWVDSPLTEEGQWEADDAGDLLCDHLVEVDEVHMSMLSRTMDTAKRALGKMREAGLRVPPDSELRSTWRLNERSYGALTGRNKKECSKEYGKEQLKLWRRSWDIPPPQNEIGCVYHQDATEVFHARVDELAAAGLFNPLDDPPPEEVPRGESLEMTQERLAPYWENTLLPSLQQGRRVMVFGHENNLRALVKILDGISNSDILEVDIPRAMPMVYVFHRKKLLQDYGIPRLEPVILRPPDAAAGSQHMAARYLVDSKLIAAFHQRDMMNVYDTNVEENLEEVCIIDEASAEPDMCETIGSYVSGSSGETSDRRKMIIDRRDETREDLTFLAVSPRTKPHLRARAGRSGHGMRAGESQVAGSSRQADGLGIGLLLAAGGLLLSVRPRRRRSPCSVPSGVTVACLAPDSLGVQEPDALDAFAFEDIPDHGDVLDAEAVDGAEEDICELLGYDLGENLIRQIGRSFTEQERLEAYEASGFVNSKPAEQPQALWLIGPSASGKSTMAPVSASWVGVKDNDYVLVDGEAFRDSHQGYQQALMHGKQNGCVWWGAYVGIRENVNKEKQRMLWAAMEASKNLVIPSTCLRKSQCVDVANTLKDNGYLVHIIGLYGDKAQIVDRGRKRAKHKGKRYDPREFTVALQQFSPMLRLCNGQYFMVNSTHKDSKVPRWQGAAPLTEEEVQRITTEVLLDSNCGTEGCGVEVGLPSGTVSED